MGSPQAEIDHKLAEVWFKKELPQHSVTIGAGFWLADTSCTQQAWQTVMGNNPSYFHNENGGGLQYPVEQVSWHDVQGFLQQLNTACPLLPMPAYLPKQSGNTCAVQEPALRSGLARASVVGKSISMAIIRLARIKKANVASIRWQ